MPSNNSAPHRCLDACGRGSSGKPASLHSYDRPQVLVPVFLLKFISTEWSIVRLSSSGHRFLIMVRFLRLLEYRILTIAQDTLAVQRLIRVGLVLFLGMPSWR